MTFVAHVADGPDVDALARLGLGDRPTARLAELVAGLLGLPRVHLLTVAVQDHPYARPAITTAGRHLVSGTAADDTGRVPNNEIRLCYGVATLEQVTEGIRRLRQAVAAISGSKKKAVATV